MKFKKLLTVLGCFALVLMCAFTVVGCGEVEATADEINAYFAQEGVDTSFDGLHFEGNVDYKDAETFGKGYAKFSGEVVTTEEDGLIGKIYVEFSVEDADSGMTSGLKTTYYLKDNKLYNEKTKKAFAIYEADMMTPMMFSMVNGLANDAADAVLGALSYGSSEGAELTLQKKGDVEKGNITFIATATKDSNKEYALIRFEENKAVELVAEMNEDGNHSKITIRKYDGKVNLPNNLNEYTDNSGSSITPPSSVLG